MLRIYSKVCGDVKLLFSKAINVNYVASLSEVMSHASSRSSFPSSYAYRLIILYNFNIKLIKKPFSS
jgi:hypothetical protein